MQIFYNVGSLSTMKTEVCVYVCVCKPEKVLAADTT